MSLVFIGVRMYNLTTNLLNDTRTSRKVIPLRETLMPNLLGAAMLEVIIERLGEARTRENGTAHA